MSNSTRFLTIPAGQALGTEVGYFENLVDFSLENVASGNTIDVLRLPKGALILRAGWIVKATQATVTFAMNVPGAGITIKSAATMGGDNAAVIVDGATIAGNKVLTSEDTIRVAVGAANCTTAKVVFFAEYIVSDSFRN